MRRILPAVLVVLALAHNRATGSEVEPPVYCPAIQHVRQVPNADSGPEMPVELVALIKPHPRPPRVKVRPGEAGPPDDDVGVADIVTTLYGHSDESRIRIHWPWTFPEQPLIVGLAPHLYEPKGTYELTFHAAADEQWAQEALAEARLDTNVLGTTTIVVGRELPRRRPDDAEDLRIELQHDRRRQVQVDQVLYGSGLATGDAIIVETSNFVRRSNDEPRVRTEPAIYLLGKIEPSRRTGKPIHALNGWLSAVCEPQVRASLARRNAHPIVDISEGGTVRKVREVLFRGSLSDALRLTGSASESAVALGTRRLLHDKAAALSPIVREIESQLFARPTTGGRYEFRRLHELIRILPNLEDPANRQSFRLLKLMLDRLANDSPPFDPSRSESLRYLRSMRMEDDDETVNHSLVWLFTAIPRTEVVEQFGPRLIALRDAAENNWRNELQFALDTCRVEDTLELRDARRRMEGALPLRTARGFWHGGDYQVVFSRDGKLLATVGDGLGQIWNTADWSPAAEFRHLGEVSRAVFSDDGRSLFIEGASSTPAIYGVRVDHGDRAVEQKLTDEDAAAAQSALKAAVSTKPADGKREAETLCERNWTDVGAFNRWSVRILSLPDRATVAECPIPTTNSNHRVHSWALSPDGRTLVVGVAYEPPKLFDADTGRLIRVGPAHQADIAHLTFDPADGDLRSFGRDEFICVWNPATLELVKRLEAPAGYGFASARPDGRFALYTFTHDLNRPAKIVDGRNGDTICELALHYNRDHNNVKVYWLDDQEALALYDQRIRRFNYRTGQVLADLDRNQLKESPNLHVGGEVAEDGRTILTIGGYKGSLSTLFQTDVATLTMTKREGFDAERHVQGHFHLVPGGKHILIDAMVYDRASLTRVGGRDVGKLRIFNTAVSPDGRRCAVLTDEVAHYRGEKGPWDKNSSSVIRIHELPSGKTSAAFTPTTRHARQLAFSPDGSRLAVLNADNTIDLWELE